MRTVAYFVNTLNTAILLKKYKIILTRFNTLILHILTLLQKLNVIDSFLINETFTACTIYFNTSRNTAFFQKIICISKPTKLIYANINDLIKLRSKDLYNDYILSINDSNQTIINIDEAIRKHKGGLLLLKIIK